MLSLQGDDLSARGGGQRISGGFQGDGDHLRHRSLCDGRPGPAQPIIEREEKYGFGMGAGEPP